MNINIIPHYCIQIPKILIGGDLEPGWVFDERLVTTVFESTAVWTSACSAVGLSGSRTPSVSTTNLCVCRGEIVRGFLHSSDIFSSSGIFTTTGKIRLTGPQIYIYGGKSQFKEIFSFAVQIIYVSQIRNNISNIQNCS